MTGVAWIKKKNPIQCFEKCSLQGSLANVILLFLNNFKYLKRFSMFYLKKWGNDSVKISKKEHVKLVTEVCSSDIHKIHHIFEDALCSQYFCDFNRSCSWSSYHFNVSVASQAISSYTSLEGQTELLTTFSLQ